MKEKKQEMEWKEGVWKGRAAYTHIHLAAGARKAQLVKVQGGHREEGAEQGWDGLVEAVLGWAGLGWSRPAGAVPGLQPPGYGLRAQSLSPRPCSVVSTADTRPTQSPVKPPVIGQAHSGGGGLRQDQS